VRSRSPLKQVVSPALSPYTYLKSEELIKAEERRKTIMSVTHDTFNDSKRASIKKEDPGMYYFENENINKIIRVDLGITRKKIDLIKNEKTGCGSCIIV